VIFYLREILSVPLVLRDFLQKIMFILKMLNYILFKMFSIASYNFFPFFNK